MTDPGQLITYRVQQQIQTNLFTSNAIPELPELPTLEPNESLVYCDFFPSEGKEMKGHELHSYGRRVYYIKDFSEPELDRLAKQISEELPVLAPHYNYANIKIHDGNFRWVSLNLSKFILQPAGAE